MSVPSPRDEFFALLTEPSWRAALNPEFKKQYMAKIANAVAEAERRSHAEPQLAPQRADIFRALNLVPVERVRAVILGQDPYPHAGDADGLAFSYRGTGRTPNALGKVLAEARRDLGWRTRPSRDLTPWAEQGVLLLNVALTNLVGETWAHGSLEWQQFTRAVLCAVADRSSPSAILLWGGKAGKFSSNFEGTQHKVFKTDHPCASRPKDGFLSTPFKGSRPFSNANIFLESAVGTEIDWSLPPRTRRIHSLAQNSEPSLTRRPVRGRTSR